MALNGRAERSTSPRPGASSEVGQRQRPVPVGERLSLGGDRLVEAPPAEVVLRPMSKAQRQPGGRAAATSGSSVRASCRWRALVLVLITTRRPAAAPAKAAGSRYPRLLPMPVPAFEQPDAAGPEDVGDGLPVLHLPGAPAEAGRRAARPGSARPPASSSARQPPGSTGSTASGPGPSGGSSATSGGGASSGAAAQASSSGSGAQRDALEQAPLHVGRGRRRAAPGARARRRSPRRPGSARCAGDSAELLDEDGQRVPVELGIEQERRVECVEPGSGERRARRRAAPPPPGAPGRTPALWPTRTASPANSRRPASASGQPGAPATSASEMPVSRVMNRGMGTPGSTSVVKRSRDGEVLVQAHGADVDDAVGPRVQAGGLGVDDDEVGTRAGHRPRIAEQEAGSGRAGGPRGGPRPGLRRAGLDGPGGHGGDEGEELGLAVAGVAAQSQGQGDLRLRAGRSGDDDVRGRRSAPGPGPRGAARRRRRSRRRSWRRRRWRRAPAPRSPPRPAARRRR